MATDCIEGDLQVFVTTHLRQCPGGQTVADANFGCLCGLSDFADWYLNALCHCNGGKDPSSSFTALCPTIAAISPPPDSCSSFLGQSPSESISSSSSLPSKTFLSSSSAPALVVTSASSSGLKTTITAVEESGTRRSSASSSPTISSAFVTQTSVSPNTTYNSTTSFPPEIESSGSSGRSGMSTGAKAGIGVGAAVAAIAIVFVFLLLLTMIRRKARKGLKYERNLGDAGDRPSNTSTTLADTYHDDEPHFYRGFGGSDSYGSDVGVGGSPKEKMGLVPHGRVREIMVDAEGEQRRCPVHVESAREIRHVDQRDSVYAGEESVIPRENDAAWHSTPPHPVPEQRDATLRYSTAQESNYEVAMRPKSRIYGVVQSPVLDLAQGDLSDEELARLEDEERRIDEAIRESESRAQMREHKGSVGGGVR